MTSKIRIQLAWASRGATFLLSGYLFMLDFYVSIAGYVALPGEAMHGSISLLGIYYLLLTLTAAVTALLAPRFRNWIPPALAGGAMLGYAPLLYLTDGLYVLIPLVVFVAIAFPALSVDHRGRYVA